MSEIALPESGLTVKTGELFAACSPGLEEQVTAELIELGMANVKPQAGGASFEGGMKEVMRANLWMRCATRILLRLDSFIAGHLKQLQKQAGQIQYRQYLPLQSAFRVSVTCKKSKIYHTNAVAERVTQAIQAQVGPSPSNDSANAVTVLVRIVKNVCTVSLDTSGTPLYQRGLKQEVCAAPLRETIAAAVLRQAGYDGSQTLLDPMCGSGTFVLEAGLLACRLPPGLWRSYAFELFPSTDQMSWQRLRQRSHRQECQPKAPIYAADRSAGAVGVTRRNLARANLDKYVQVDRQRLADQQPREGHGLVVCNPPYGARLGKDRKRLLELYRQIGQVVGHRFAGWRVFLVTADERLAAATKLPFTKVSKPVSHGGLRIRIYEHDPAALVSH